MGVDYEYIDVDAIEHAADEARAISGRTNIPVVTFPDGTHFVEPSDAELRAKVEALLAAQAGRMTTVLLTGLERLVGAASVSP